jgi:hypothetical protein
MIDDLQVKAKRKEDALLAERQANRARAQEYIRQLEKKGRK